MGSFHNTTVHCKEVVGMGDLPLSSESLSQAYIHVDAEFDDGLAPHKPLQGIHALVEALLAEDEIHYKEDVHDVIPSMGRLIDLQEKLISGWAVS